MTQLIYIWGIIPSIIGFFGFLTAIFAVLAIIAFVAGADEKHKVDNYHYDSESKSSMIDKSNRLFKRAKKMTVLSIISSMILTFIPNKETFAAMIIIPEIAKSDAIKKDLPEIYDMAIKKIKDELK